MMTSYTRWSHDDDEDDDDDDGGDEDDDDEEGAVRTVAKQLSCIVSLSCIEYFQKEITAAQ